MFRTWEVRDITFNDGRPVAINVNSDTQYKLWKNSFRNFCSFKKNSTV